ncbi:hypothetical protein HX837_07170 [Marine Group I thaumarchaeote]|uniref:Uncharacterized protein n=1 Tax=Marine Group I thaumarchaeote TaxID=2511932 RepID=A0A7K4MQZ0_9ARCH|nr:hypothetical protein [Marine Group I thaumarchaeote]
MANQSTQKYIDGEKNWITAMLASAPVIEGKSPEQVEKLLIQEIKEPEVDIDPDVEKEITELQENKLNEEKKEIVQESLEVAKFDVNELTDFFSSVTQAKKQLKSKVKEETVKIDRLEQLFDTLSANKKKKKVIKKRPKKLLLEPEELKKVKETIEDPGVPQSVKEEALKQLDEKEENKYIKAVEKQLSETRYQSELDKDRIKTLDRIDSFDKMKQEFANFKDKVSIQLASLGGGGSANILDNHDVDISAKGNSKVLAFNSTTDKMEFVSNAEASFGSVAQDILPDADGTRSLGSATKRWKEIFLSSTTVNLGGSTISSDGTGPITIAATGATLPAGSKAGSNELVVKGTGTNSASVSINSVPFFTRSGGLVTKNATFEFNATLDNNKPFLDQSTFVLANGSGLTSADTITIFQL